jgi:ubiquitin carboxyl-terminal hydrolase 22/27/51
MLSPSLSQFLLSSTSPITGKSVPVVNNNSAVAPVAFLDKLWSFADYLAGYQEQDAHEFMIALLNALHTHSSTKTSSEKQQQQQQQQQQQTSPTCSCVVHSVFGGVMLSELCCTTCGGVSSRLDPFFDISLDLSSMTKGWGDKNGNHNTNNGVGDSSKKIEDVITKGGAIKPHHIITSSIMNANNIHKYHHKSKQYLQLQQQLLLDWQNKQLQLQQQQQQDEQQQEHSGE